jgi:hypothetical protein
VTPDKTPLAPMLSVGLVVHLIRLWERGGTTFHEEPDEGLEQPPTLGGVGVEGLLKDSDKLYTYVHCTILSVASESLSTAPHSICPLVAPDLVKPSQGTPPSPPPRCQTLSVDGEGEWGEPH